MLGRDELIILSGDRRGEVIPLKEDRFVVGRETGDLLLEDTEVSSIHALFLRTGRQWAVQDLGSTNGVWVDGIAYDEATLRDGADIVIGTTRLVLRTNDVFRGEETTDPGSEIPQPEIDLSWVHALADPGHTLEFIPETIYDDLTPTVELTIEALDDPEAEYEERLAKRRAQRPKKRRPLPPPDLLGPGLDELPPVEIVLTFEGHARRGVLEARFHQDAISIGRDPSVDLPLDGGSVSGRHCAIEVFPAGEAFIRDLGSTNGTWVNGGKVSWARLRVGDRIRIGGHQFRFSTRTKKVS